MGGLGKVAAEPAWLVRASTKIAKTQQTQTARLDSPCPLPSSPAPLSCLLHSCSRAALFRVLDSTRPCLGDTTHSLGIGSFNSVSFHLHRPGHPLPISQSRAATTSPVTSRYVSTLRAHHRRLSILFLLRPEPLFFRSMSHHHCPHAPGSGMPSIPTFAWHVPAWASNKVGPHSRVDTCPPTSPPGASPIYPSLYSE